MIYGSEKGLCTLNRQGSGKIQKGRQVTHGKARRPGLQRQSDDDMEQGQGLNAQGGTHTQGTKSTCQKAEHHSKLQQKECQIKYISPEGMTHTFTNQVL